MKLTIGVATFEFTESDKNILTESYFTNLLNGIVTKEVTKSPTTTTAKKPVTRKRKASTKKEPVKKQKESDIPDHILGDFSDVSDIINDVNDDMELQLPDHDTKVQPVRKDTTITAPIFTTQRHSQVFEKQSK